MPSLNSAILIAGALIALSIIALPMFDRWAIGPVFTIDGHEGVWRINERNGSVSPCFPVVDTDPKLGELSSRYSSVCRN